MVQKEEILARSKRTGLDEREEMIEGNSFGYGLVTVLALAIIFGVWKMLHGVRSFELISIFTGYLATIGFYKLKKLNSKRFLIGGILGAWVSIASTIAFFLGK